MTTLRGAAAKRPFMSAIVSSSASVFISLCGFSRVYRLLLFSPNSTIRLEFTFNSGLSITKTPELAKHT